MRECNCISMGIFLFDTWNNFLLYTGKRIQRSPWGFQWQEQGKSSTNNQANGGDLSMLFVHTQQK